MKKIFILLFIIPFFIKAQTWQLCSNKKVVLKGNIGETKSYQVSAKNIGQFAIKYFADDTQKMWNKTIVIMDTNRVEVFRKSLKKNDIGMSFNKKHFDIKIFSKPLIVYIVVIPSDKKMAATIKVAPVLLVKLIPKN